MGTTMLGKGRKAISMILDEDSFEEGRIDGLVLPEIGPGAVIGTGMLKRRKVTVIANDAMAANLRFPVVYAGIIGMEEAYKMALAVYSTIEADADKPLGQKRPLVLIVDTPGNGPGKVEEIFGMNKATGAYQLSLAEAREQGHPVVAMVIGRAISGAFLCHGLQADQPALEEVADGHLFPPVVVGVADDEAGENEEEIDGQVSVIDFLVQMTGGVGFEQMEADDRQGCHSAQSVQ